MKNYVAAIALVSFCVYASDDEGFDPNDRVGQVSGALTGTAVAIETGLAEVPGGEAFCAAAGAVLGEDVEKAVKTVVKDVEEACGDDE